jgi:hypothetical protein
MTAIQFVDLLSAVVVVMAIVSAVVSLWATRQRQVALTVLLDLLTAASMLRLAADTDFIRAATASVVLVIRRMASWSFSLDRAGRWPNREFPRDISLATVRERLSHGRIKSRQKRPRGSPSKGH